MGNHRFKLSDMMPNAWFYKLRDMSKPRNQNPIKKKTTLPTQNPKTPFYHNPDQSRRYTSTPPKNPKFLDTHFPYDPPRKSLKKRAKRKTIYKPSPKQITPDCIFHEPDQNFPVWLKPTNINFHDYFQGHDPDDFLESHLSESDSFDGSNSCSCKLSSSATDIIIDVDEISYDRCAEFNMISEPELTPIITKPTKKHIPIEKSPKNKSPSVKKRNTSPGTRKSVSRPGVKIRGNGPKIGSKKIEARKSVKGEKKGLFYSESLAIVKASIDPERDFRDSMLEMIVENNIRASKDLEDLLACYLSLNSNQYHGLIIKAFEQIWFNMPEPHF